jgi:hypothetical protein
MAMTSKKRPLIIGPKSDNVLLGALTVTSGGWLIGVLVGGRTWANVLGLFVLFGTVVASTMERRRLS